MPIFTIPKPPALAVPTRPPGPSLQSPLPGAVPLHQGILLRLGQEGYLPRGLDQRSLFHALMPQSEHVGDEEMRMRLLQRALLRGRALARK